MRISANEEPLKTRHDDFAPRSSSMITFSASAVTGIWVDRWIGSNILSIEPPHRLTLWLSISAIIAMTLAFVSAESFLARRCKLICIPLFAGFHAIAGCPSKTSPLTHILTPQAQPCIVRGTVVSKILVLRHENYFDATKMESSSRFTMEIEEIRVGQSFEPITGKIHVTLNCQHGGLRFGSRFTIAGKIKSYDVPTNPGEVNRYQIYQRRDIRGKLNCNHSSLIKIESEPPQASALFWNQVHRISDYGVDAYFRVLKEQNAIFASAIGLGRRESISESTRNQLIVTGTAHLLSVSGLHLGLLVGSFHYFSTILRIRRCYLFFCVIAICFAYSSLTGMKPPVIRAAVMVTIWVISLSISRPNQSINNLSLCFFLFLCYDCSLLFEIGVQLSFLAVGTILFLNDQAGHSGFPQKRESKKSLPCEIESLSEKTTSNGSRLLIWGLIKSLYISAGIFLAMTPFLWLHFHVVSPISILANLIITPLLFIALISSLTLPVACFIHESLGQLVSIPTNLILDLIRVLVRYLSEIPFGHYWWPSPSNTSVALYYCGMPSLIYILRKKNLIWTLSLVFFAWLFFQLKLDGTPRANQPLLEVVFLDVGHGTCVIVRDERDRAWLYDCGSFGSSGMAARIVPNALWQMGVSKIQGVFLSHADSDHYNGLHEVITRFDVGTIYTTDTTLSAKAIILRRLFQQAEDLGVRVSTVSTGDKIEGLGDFCRILHPRKTDTYHSDNESSLVLEIRVGNQCLLFPGDIEAVGMQTLMANQSALHQTITMAPHHGSLTSLSDEFIRWSDPKICIISGRARAADRSITKLLDQHNVQHLSTHEHHAIRITLFEEDRQVVQHWRNQGWNSIPAKDVHRPLY